MPPGWGPTEGNAALDNAFTNYPFMQLHTGQPGPAGTNNVATGVARVTTSGKMAAAAAGSKSSNAIVDFGTASASETYTHCSFWSLVAGGTFGFSGTVVANPVSSGDQFQIPSGQLTASVTLAS